MSLGPAFLIDMDADLYISSIQALDYIFREQLARPGTLIGYDDWWESPCASNDVDVWKYGEAKAHKEIAIKYNVTFRCLAGSCKRPKEGFFKGKSIYNTRGPIYIILDMGKNSKADTGFDMSTLDIKDFMAKSSRC